MITGGSSGIGLSTSLALSEAGFIVYELSRRDSDAVSKIPSCTHIPCDVTDDFMIDSAIKQIIQIEDHIDVLINNAGFGIAGAVEFTDTEEARRQFDVNFFGMVRMNRKVIPLMRQQGYGKILNVSSVAATFPLPFQTFYSASKAAINSYTMATANELRPFNVQMCAIQPGDIATGFTDARKKIITGDDIYHGRIGKNFKGIEKDERTGQSPAMAGKILCRIALKKHVKPIYTMSFVYQLLCFLDRILPKQLVNALLYLLYAR